MMKKIVVVILMLGMIGLCACGNKESNETSGNTQNFSSESQDVGVDSEDNTQNVGDTENTQNTEKTENTESVKNTETEIESETSKEQDSDTEESEEEEETQKQEEPQPTPQPTPTPQPQPTPEPEPGTQTEGTTPVVPKETYTVNIKTAGNMALTGIDVIVYGDASLTDMKGYATTDDLGNVSFTLDKGDSYHVVVTNVPKGYAVQNSYPFTGTTTNITLTSSLIQGEDLSTAGPLEVGDVMYDFSVTTPEGVTYTLSEVLAEKKMVMLNFWYVECSWCAAEFPCMTEAYETYKNDIEIFALNSLGWNSEATIQQYKEQNGLPFVVAACPERWAYALDVYGYPTSIFIDRYGVICAIEEGAITSVEPFNQIFEYFTSDTYQQQLFPERFPFYEE